MMAVYRDVSRDERHHDQMPPVDQWWNQGRGASPVPPRSMLRAGRRRFLANEPSLGEADPGPRTGDESMITAGFRHALVALVLYCGPLQVTPALAGLHGEVTDYGETTAERERPARQTPDDHSLVPRTTIERIRYLDRSSSLPAHSCLRFGVTVRLSSDDGGQLPSKLIVVITHPRITRPDQASSIQDSFPTPVLRDTAYAGWTFDHTWEQQPGQWVVTFMDGSEVIASKTFTITVPSPGGSRCPANPVS